MLFPDIKDDLPKGTPEFTLPSNHRSIAQLFTREVYRNIDEPDNNPYLIMKSCPPEFVERIYENPRLYDMPQIRIFYDESARVMVAKKPPDIGQELAKSIFTQTMIMNMVETQGGTGLGLYGELMTTGRTTWDLAGRLPSFVIERGYMDFIERMRAEAAWWIPASKGDIKIAVVLGFNCTKSVLVLEEWRAAEQDVGDQGDGDGDGNDVRRPTPIKSQMVAITLSEEGEYQVTGAPFTTQFCDLFLREPATLCIPQKTWSNTLSMYG